MKKEKENANLLTDKETRVPSLYIFEFKVYRPNINKDKLNIVQLK